MLQARTASAESAVKVAQSAAVQSAGTISELRRQLDAQQHSLGTAQAAVKTGAQRLEYARVQHAEEKAGLEGHLREVQEQLWEAEEKVCCVPGASTSARGHYLSNPAHFRLQRAVMLESCLSYVIER